MNFYIRLSNRNSVMVISAIRQLSSNSGCFTISLYSTSYNYDSTICSKSYMSVKNVETVF